MRVLVKKFRERKIEDASERIGANDSDVYLLKTDSLGDSLWAKTCGDSSSETGYSVCQLTDSGFVVAGVTGDNGGDVYVVRTDKMGDTIWTKTLGRSGEDKAFSVVPADEGGFIIARAEGQATFFRN